MEVQSIPVKFGWHKDEWRAARASLHLMGVGKL